MKKQQQQATASAGSARAMTRVPADSVAKGGIGPASFTEVAIEAYSGGDTLLVITGNRSLDDDGNGRGGDIRIRLLEPNALRALVAALTELEAHPSCAQLLFAIPTRPRIA